MVVIVTKGALQDGDLLEEIRVALESEVQIVLVTFAAEVPDINPMLDAMEDPVLKSNVSRIIPLPYLSGEGTSVGKGLGLGFLRVRVRVSDRVRVRVWVRVRV